jgi:hypothetical protein
LNQAQPTPNRPGSAGLSVKRTPVDSRCIQLERGTCHTLWQRINLSFASREPFAGQRSDLVLEAATPRVRQIMADLPDDPADRIDELVRRLAEIQFGDEALWRAILRADLERWAHEAVLDPEARVPARGTNRLDMVQEALAPLPEQLPPELHRNLIMATMLVCGMEALVAARDACGLEPDEATKVMRWAARALLQVALRDATSPPTPPTIVSH